MGNGTDNDSRQRKVSEETLLKTAKEIVVKFIETGRINPATFDSAFKNIYRSLEETIRGEKQ